jgi:hypothetical protein
VSIRRELISQALAARFSELCGERISHLLPATFGEMASFVSRLREQLLNASPADLKNLTSEMSQPAGWMVSNGDCLASLRALSTNEPAELEDGHQPPPDAFLEPFISSRQDSARRFQLLTERYAWPLNFSHSAEAEARELVLARLMVQDRTRIEKTALPTVVSSDLLLSLNLVAVHAARVPDLRFLDALNYYYELLPSGWQPPTAHGWLLISYFALYARALAAWI